MEEGTISAQKLTHKKAMRLAQVKLPVPTEFITSSSTPRLGDITSDHLDHPVSAAPLSEIPELSDMRKEGGAAGVIQKREQLRLQEMQKAVERLSIQQSDSSSSLGDTTAASL